MSLENLETEEQKFQILVPFAIFYGFDKEEKYQICKNLGFSVSEHTPESLLNDRYHFLVSHGKEHIADFFKKEVLKINDERCQLKSLDDILSFARCYGEVVKHEMES